MMEYRHAEISCPEVKLKSACMQPAYKDVWRNQILGRHGIATPPSESAKRPAGATD